MKSRLSAFFIYIFLVVSTLTIYWQVTDYDFINFDDTFHVTENSLVQSGITKRGLIWALAESHFANWYPLTWISHMLDCHLFGLNPGMHHLTNVLFHLTNSLLLFLVIKKLTGAMWRSAFVAALFALHPLHVESVAWISERKDVLSTFFWMLCIWAYTNYTRKPGIGRYVLVAIFFTLGLLSKPMVVTLPFVLLLMDYWPLQRLTFGQQNKKGSTTAIKTRAFQIGWEKAPLFLLSAASSVATFVVEKQGGGMAPSDQFSVNTRISNALISYVSYIGKMVWPDGLAVFYPYPLAIPMWK
ncbi:MAG: glycosyltransferase family 39 protein, partial [Deltaproteobacteria bacterium]|nr:glycosyltransferase family 39 protein [Deltaproteobacteria bacterium]